MIIIFKDWRSRCRKTRLIICDSLLLIVDLTDLCDTLTNTNDPYDWSAADGGISPTSCAHPIL